jgi:AcrR family transcriptional regulator
MVRADAQLNAERLRNAAEQVFAERGLGAPLEDIATRAGVSVGTLYNRFGSRAGLIDEVMPNLLRDEVRAIATAAASRADTWACFSDYMLGLLEMQIRNPALAESIAQAPLGSRLADECTRTMDDVVAVLSKAQSAGTARLDATVEDVQALLVANVAVISTLGPGAARRLTDVTLAGLRAGPSPVT